MQDYKVSNEKVTKLLNEWYQEMRAQQILKATQLKKEIDTQINALAEQDQNLLLYYSLLDFRYKLLTDDFGIGKDSFDKIEELNTPSDQMLNYYYHFFKAIHSTVLTNFSEAKEHYTKAEEMLDHIPDILERAEFYYRFSTFNYQTYQPLVAIKYADKAKEIFSKNKGYDINIASCENVYGLACVDLRQYEQAEESFNSSINILNKMDEKKLILRVRSNLGWLYASQNLSALAIRHLSEVTLAIPNHFKALFSEAEENYKLGNNELAKELIERGLDICHKINNVEYLHRFRILQKLNENVPAAELEVVVQEGLSYFEKENLLECMQEYTEKLASKYYDENNTVKASEYYHRSINVKKQYFEKGALK